MGIPSYGADYEGQYDFLQIGTITSAQAALAVTARDNASVVALAAAKKVIWSPDNGTAAAILRFRTDGDEDDAPVIQVYAAKGADYYTRIGTLTLAQGTQDWSGGHFVDEITLSNEAWAHGIRANSVTDEVGRVVFNTGGFDRFLFIASTLAVTTVHIDIARLDKQIDHGIEIHSAILVLADNMTVSDVVSAISDMHSDITAQNDSIIDQVTSAAVYVESCADDLESITALQNSIADNTNSAVDAIDEVRSGNLSAATLLEATLEAIDSDVIALESALSGHLSDVVAANDAIRSGNLSAATLLEATGESVRSGNLSAATLLEASLDSIETDAETIANNTDSAVDAIDEVAGIQDSALNDLDSIEATAKVISGHTTSATALLNSVADELDSTVTLLNSVADELDSAVVLQNSIADNTNSAVDAIDEVTASLITVGSAIESHLTLVQTEVSDAISNLKAAVEAHGDIGLISGPETVVVDSNTETLSELGIALEADIRRVTLIPAGSGIYWAAGAATQGVNPFPNAVTQIDCNRSQILAREFVTSANVSVAMQVIQEG